MNQMMIDSVIEEIKLDLDFSAAGSKSFRNHVLWVLPNFFKNIDNFPSDNLILSSHSKLSALFFNYCLFDNIPGRRLHYPQFLILELFQGISNNTFNFKELAKLQENILKRATYPHSICIDGEGTVKDNEVWLENKNKKFKVIKFINL